MRVTTKGQVTIPRRIREILGIAPETDIDFQEENGRFYIVKTSKNKPIPCISIPSYIQRCQLALKELKKLKMLYVKPVSRFLKCLGKPCFWRERCFSITEKARVLSIRHSLIFT